MSFNFISAVISELWENCFSSKNQCICLYIYKLDQIKVMKKRFLCKDFLQICQCSLSFFIEVKESHLLVLLTVLQQISERSCENKIIMNKLVIKVYEVKKHLNVMITMRCWSFHHSFHSIQLHSDFFHINYKL